MFGVGSDKGDRNGGSRGLFFASQQSCPPPRQGGHPEPLEVTAWESPIDPGNWHDIGNGALRCLRF